MSTTKSKQSAPQHHAAEDHAESEDTDISAEEEAPVEHASEDASTEISEDEDTQQQHHQPENPAGSGTGVPDFRKARASSSHDRTSAGRRTKSAEDGAAVSPASVVPKTTRHAAAAATKAIHATSTTGLSEARLAQAEARAREEKRKSRKRAASSVSSPSAEPSPKKARTSRAGASGGGSGVAAATPRKRKRTAGSAAGKKRAKASGSANSKKATGAKKQSISSHRTLKSAGKTKSTPKKKSATASSSSSSSPSKKQETKKMPAPTPVGKNAPKRLSLADAHAKYHARLALMPASDFAVLDGKWISVYEPQLRKRATFPEGHFAPKWTQILADVARQKGANIKGVLPHYAHTIEGTDGLKAYEKGAHIVDWDLVKAYHKAGFGKVEGSRIYVGEATPSGLAASPFAFGRADTLDDHLWQAIKKALDAEGEEAAPAPVPAAAAAPHDSAVEA